MTVGKLQLAFPRDAQATSHITTVVTHQVECVEMPEREVVQKNKVSLAKPEIQTSHTYFVTQTARAVQSPTTVCVLVDKAF